MWERGAKDKMAIDLDRCISDHLGLPGTLLGLLSLPLPGPTRSHRAMSLYIPLRPRVGALGCEAAGLPQNPVEPATAVRSQRSLLPGVYELLSMR